MSCSLVVMIVHGQQPPQYRIGLFILQYITSQLWSTDGIFLSLHFRVDVLFDLTLVLFIFNIGFRIYL